MGKTYRTIHIDDNGSHLLLEDNEGNLIEEFDTKEEIVSYVKDNFGGNMMVVDSDEQGTVWMEEGDVVRVNSPMGVADQYLKNLWNQEDESDRDGEPDCRACGDGGCPHCEPSSFF